MNHQPNLVVIEDEENECWCYILGRAYDNYFC